jgi:amidase
LHGIPILIKDNLDTHDRMTTTAGSLALEGSVPPRDSFVADRLREAGAVILGKTNLSEWANFRSTRSTSGWSGRGGQTRNPYALDRNPSGSSSGSAVAVAANLCAAAVGTETDGSIVSPASTNGIVGIKPTVGLISRAGIVPISHSQDTAGPMARTVTDAAILLGLMTGEDPRDPSTGPSRGKAHPDYTRFLDVDGLRGVRLGIVREHFKMHPQVEILMESVVSQLKQLGAVLVDSVALAHTKEVAKAEDEVLSYEFKAGINAYLASLGPNAPRRTLRELVEFNERNRDREMPWFGQELFIEAESRGPLTDQAYLDALEKCRRLSRDEGIDALIKEHQLDALVAPTSQPAWAIDWVCGDHWLGGSSAAAAVAGYPSITVPAGLASGLPVGVSFFGRAWDEPALLRMAFAFEQATLLRQPPRFLPSVVAGDPLTFRGLPRES